MLHKIVTYNCYKRLHKIVTWDCYIRLLHKIVAYDCYIRLLQKIATDDYQIIIIYTIYKFNIFQVSPFSRLIVVNNCLNSNMFNKANGFLRFLRMKISRKWKWRRWSMKLIQNLGRKEKIFQLTPPKPLKGMFNALVLMTAWLHSMIKVKLYE